MHLIQYTTNQSRVKSILQCLSFLIVSGDREGEEEHDDHDGEEDDGDEGDNKGCNESAASLQIILQDIRDLVTVTLVQDSAHTEIITIHKVKDQPPRNLQTNQLSC